jgi:hypothetical protein
MPSVLPPFEPLLKRAVAHYWRTLNEQSAKQKSGDADRGGRAAVTGGKQMDGFCELVDRVLVKNQLPKAVSVLATGSSSLDISVRQNVGTCWSCTRGTW